MKTNYMMTAEDVATELGIEYSCAMKSHFRKSGNLFFASTFWTKLQNIFGHYCKSKLDKVAKPRLAAILPAA